MLYKKLSFLILMIKIICSYQRIIRRQRQLTKENKFDFLLRDITK